MKKIVPIVDTTPFLLYLDLDGVFADMERKVFEISGCWPYQLEKKTFWKIVMANKDFFISLDLMPDADKLWEYTRQYKPIFLTGAPPGESFRNQKKEWVAKKFGEEWSTIVLPKKDKQLHSGPYKVLVDDTPINIDQWFSKGGHGVLHKDVWDTIEQLEELRLNMIV